ncbi:VCBS repeat-containing protein [Chondrinema litorale]|uniref:VCBS repeat-containing protein n=1 Tax=Chondrinema litorale TaxID=2994555 RepID=UPI002543AFE1|nr:VCBS repeat-containing protein [Chondrinema litorale]UZR96518.1 VCBS repeat-containing protein [Chondrinema litorale]
MNKNFTVILSLIVLLSCQKKDEKLLELLDPSYTGVTFQNKIVENKQFNILDIYYLYNGGGVSVADFNNDGLTDIFFTGNMVENRLYLNKGDLQFKDVTDETGIGALGKWSYGSSVVDINSDGLMDIYVCASISADPEERTNMLFINQGINEDGIPTFEDKAKDFGLAIDSYSTHAAFFDYDQDGDLDVLVLTNAKIEGIPSVYKSKVNDGSSPITDQLYRNNGDGTFTEVSTEAGIVSEGFGLGIATSDFDQDGNVDLYIGNDFITNDLMYLNNNGKFSEKIDSAIKHQSRFSMGNDVADINNDGNVDIITLDMLPEKNLRKKTVMIPNGYIVYINDYKYGYTHQYVRNMLQLNNGNMKFSEIGQVAGIHQTEWSWSPLFVDFDNDGYKDLAITNGYPKDITDLDFINFRMETSGFVSTEDLLKQIPSVKIPNYVFRNNGDLTFEDNSSNWGFTQPSFSNGAAYADLDNDGDLDYIVNNINDPAFIYENTLYKGEKRDSHYLRIKLKGNRNNASALGTKVIIQYDGGKKQYHEQNIYRGYVSTVEDIIHFGLGQSAKIEEVKVIWPDKKVTILKDVNADQVLNLSQAEAKAVNEQKATEKSTLFKHINNEVAVNFVHQEEDFIDYNMQQSIPHKFSQYGPSLAVGDLNGDGMDDFYVGGSKGVEGSIFFQQKNGKFTQRKGEKNTEKQEEDMGVLIFDADADGDNDLYVSSGGFENMEGSASMKDRLYFNDGSGNLKLNEIALPALANSSSCVRGADYDGDGDIDLFVGGRVKVKAYPLAPNSTILENQGNGEFKDATSQISEGLSNIGMVTDAIWSDYDNDNDVDLIVVGEFMSITVFENQNGKLAKASTTGLESSGLWNSIIAGDFDKDGDSDYIVGNIGINNFYCASPETPLQIFAKDFDDNGDVDAIMSCFLKSEDGSLQSYPVQAWQQLSKQSPIFRKRFASYKEYGTTKMNNLLSPQELQGATILSVDHLKSSYVENLGNGNFKISPLPLEAQIAPVNGMNIGDFNGDSNLDVALVGNDYGNEVNMGQYDALIGLVLLGDGNGQFKPMSVTESGFMVEGDAKALSKLVLANEQEIYLATQNRGKIEVYASAKQNAKNIEVAPLEYKAELTYSNGKKEQKEIQYGSGFLSQSTRKISIEPEVEKVVLFSYNGESRTIDIE